MKVLKENPLTKGLHEFWRAKIKTDLSLDSSFLSPIQYLNTLPKAFYSKKAYDAYSSFLNNSELIDANLLLSILNEVESDLDRANAVLNEINEIPIHDVLLPDDNIELIDFINSQIHFNLLKLYESGLAVILLVVARFNRARRGKSPDGLDLYNIVEELKNTDFSFVNDLYHNTVRNGIAHGKVVFAERTILYTDKKGNTEELSVREIMKTFDSLVDTLNGFCLALKVFIFSKQREIVIPKSILTEELQIACKTPGWRIINCFESVTIGNKKQFTVYVRNQNWDSGKVKWYCFFTAYWAELLTRDYERVFISLNSHPSLPGWAAFDAGKLRELRMKDTQNLVDYREALEDGGIQFMPKYKFPSILFKLGTYRNAVLVLWELQKLTQRNTQLNHIEVRDTHFHSKKTILVVANSSVVLSSATPSDCLKFIGEKYSQVVRKVISNTKRRISPLSIRRYLPVKYIRVSIYDTNERARNLRYSGLTSELIATIQVNTSKNIKVPDLINSRVEQRGLFRIFWNKNWRHYQPLEGPPIDKLAYQ